MSAEPVPQQPKPATRADLGHPIRYPLHVDDAWRACCSCHWWQELDSDEAERAVQ